MRGIHKLDNFISCCSQVPSTSFLSSAIVSEQGVALDVDHDDGKSLAVGFLCILLQQHHQPADLFLNSPPPLAMPFLAGDPDTVSHAFMTTYYLR